MTQSPATPLADPLALPLRPSGAVALWGPTLVIAPHPDDESLGCGGAIALLREFRYPVNVLVISDGTGSHPHSQRYPAPALRALREAEARDAVRELGVAADAIDFLRLPDTAVPTLGSPHFAAAVERCCAVLQRVRPETVLVPWRRDPHCDHRASFQIVQAAVARCLSALQIIEYPVWVWELADTDDWPTSTEAEAWRLDIQPVVAQKQAAIAAHRSQLTDLIDDDPTGFRLTNNVLRHFAQPWELYLEACI